MRSWKIFVAAGALCLAPMQPANGWELSVPGEDETLVRTYFNPAFGPFDVFLPPANNKKSWDIQNYGVFYLNVYCSGSKYLVLTRFQKWNDEESMWKSIPFEKSSSLSMKFGKSNVISWGTRLQENVDGVVITNSNLFMELNEPGSGNVSVPLLSASAALYFAACFAHNFTGIQSFFDYKVFRNHYG